MELKCSVIVLEPAIGRLSESKTKQRSTGDKPEEAQGGNLGRKDDGPAHSSSFGSNIEDLFDHSYERPKTHRWVWVPRYRVLDPARIGVPASREENTSNW